MTTAITPDMREELRWLDLIGIADGACEERRQEARQAALRAYHRHEPGCMFRLRFDHAMLTGKPL